MFIFLIQCSLCSCIGDYHHHHVGQDPLHWLGLVEHLGCLDVGGGHETFRHRVQVRHVEPPHPEKRIHVTSELQRDSSYHINLRFTWSTRRPGPSLSARAPRPPPAGCSPRRQLQHHSGNIVTSHAQSPSILILNVHLQRGRELCTFRARVKAPGQRTRHPRQCPGSVPRERRETGGSCRCRTRGCWKTCWTSQHVRTVFYVNRNKK